MSTKTIYSPLMKKGAFPRTITTNDQGKSQITPKGPVGSHVFYGKFVDTGDVYPSMSELSDDRYRNYFPGHFIHNGQNQGTAWLPAEESRTIWSAMAHRVSRPGTHYLIEWKATQEFGPEPVNEDYSPLYETIEEAREQIEQHIEKTSGNYSDEQTQLEVEGNGTHYSLIPGPYDEQSSKNPYCTNHDYRIAEIVVPRDVYDQASDQPDTTYFLDAPHTHFSQPSRV